MGIKYIIGAACSCISIISFGANAALVERLGGLAYYDTDIDITWIANANLAASNTFGVVGINIDGSMDWATANSWINAMNIDGGIGYLGYNDWRLPITTQPLIEMEHLNTVEGIYWDSSESEAPFTNLQFNEYWSGTEYASDTSKAWAYSFDLGGLGAFDKSYSGNYTWAVRSGDVSSVPIPAGAWLFGSGLLGLMGIVRHRKQ